MKTASAVSLALFLGSMTLLAQNSGRIDSQLTVAHATPASTGCPIGMQAQQQLGEGSQAFVGNKHNRVAQNIRFTLTNSKFAEIVGLRITVRGLNAKGRVSPAQTAADESSEITKSLDLKLKVGPKSQASVNLELPGFTSVRSIELNSVRYADGSHWRSSATHTCHAVPDRLMLISSR